MFINPFVGTLARFRGIRGEGAAPTGTHVLHPVSAVPTGSYVLLMARGRYRPDSGNSQRRGDVLAVTVERFLSVQMFLILFLLIFLVKY